MLRFRLAALTAALSLALVSLAHAQAPIEYRLSFADYTRHLVDVEVVFSEVTQDPLEIHMSRTSPGRYSLHDFARNVFAVQISDGAGRPLVAQQPSLSVWRVKDHGGTVRLKYRVFGNDVDGTYLGVDARLAHLNIPATLMWATGLEARPSTLTFVPPPDVTWTVATQLYPTGNPLVFTAPNLAYLIDSPVQFGPQTLRTFQVAPTDGSSAPAATIRLALHHDGTDAEADRYAAKVEKVVRESRGVFGELPAFETGTYTFLASYGPGNDGDGMEHRNSTVITSSGTLAANETGLLGTVAHEFFHAWNAERIRPRSLEPFNLDEPANATELWVAEGFTQYYGPLVLARAGLITQERFFDQLAGTLNAVNASAGRRIRFAPEMSRFAAFADGACSQNKTDLRNTFLSYYTFGAAIAWGLDLELRDRTDGKVSLDDYMRALWTTFGRTPAPPGTVATPYTAADLEATLAEVSGSVSFARDFFERFVDGPELVEYGMLLRRLGLLWRPALPGQPWIGDLPMASGTQGAPVTGVPPMGTPAYEAGFGEGDVIVSVRGAFVRNGADVMKIVDAAKPGDRLDVVYLRQGKSRQTTLVPRGNPARVLVTKESAGETPTAEELAMRQAWLRSRAN